jgi:hypothetical protein
MWGRVAYFLVLLMSGEEVPLTFVGLGDNDGGIVTDGCLFGRATPGLLRVTNGIVPLLVRERQ